MPTLKELVIRAVNAKTPFDVYTALYKQAKDDLLIEMQKQNVMTYKTRTHTVSRAQSRVVDEEKLEKMYPEIYLAGIEYKFNLYKAMKVMPRKLVNNAVYQCRKEEKEHVKLQRKTRNIKGREIEKFSPTVDVSGGRTISFDKFQEQINTRYQRHHDRFKHHRIRKSKKGKAQTNMGRPRRFCKK